MTPEGEARLRWVARRAAADVTASAREDVIEELLSDLFERVRERTAAGDPEDVAVDAAIAGFGDVASVGREFAMTYRGLIWASTIGVLRAPQFQMERTPPVLFLIGVLLIPELFIPLFWAVAAIGASPIRMVLLAILAIAGPIAVVVMIRGLFSGAAWVLRPVGLALAVDVAVCLGTQLDLFGAQLRAVGIGWQPYAGNLFWRATPSLANAAFAAALLTLLVVVGRRLRPRLVKAGAPPRRVQRVVGSAFVASFVVMSGGSGLIPDPTQVVPSDLSLVVSATCGPADSRLEGIPAGTPVMTVTLRGSWRRSDLVPFGVFSARGSDPGDDAYMEAVAPAAFATEGSGRLTPGWNVASPPTPQDRLLVWPVFARPDPIFVSGLGRDSASVAASYVLWNPGDPTAALPRVTAGVLHRERFVVAATVGCGDSVPASLVLRAPPG